ncbi:MAG: EF-hand domain-containing protein [Sphingomonadaceae bacterium]|nr:EF-hand domain-containing protein [Sphingomonadaceae bacterium]
MKLQLMLSGAALLAVAGFAAAQPPGDRPGPEGDVTRQQVIAHVDEMFARLDANHDGRITQDERQAMREHRRAEMQQRRAEMQQHMFDRLDANHDGAISREEFAAAHAMRGPGGPEGPGGPDGPDGPHRMRMGGGPGGMHGRMMMFAGDGDITLEQARAQALAHFDRADANHDGTLTPDERRAAREQMRGGPDEPRPN